MESRVALERWASGEQKQIPCGNDRQKSRGNSKGEGSGSLVDFICRSHLQTSFVWRCERRSAWMIRQRRLALVGELYGDWGSGGVCAGGLGAAVFVDAAEDHFA